MTLVGFKARNHPQQAIMHGANPSVDDRATTPETFAPLNERFGFTLNVAASPHNAKLDRYLSIHDDGLSQSWAGERVWCNPPFSNCPGWVEKAWLEWRTGEVGVICMIVPANRTEQKWWQAMVEPYRDRSGSPLRVEFMPGRPRFIHPDATEVKPNERPPFGCCLLIWGAVCARGADVAGGRT